MKTVDKYKIIWDMGPSFLQLAVENHIKEGWQPLGAPFVDKGCYHQALVKYAPEPNTGPK